MEDLTSAVDGNAASDIDALLAELATSGMNTAAFARSKGLPAWKLYNALRTRNQRRQRSSHREADFAPVVVKPLTLADHPRIELVVNQSMRIAVPDTFNESTLRRLLGVLATC